MDPLTRSTFIEPTPAMSANYATVVASEMAGRRYGIKGEGCSFTLWTVKGVATFTAEGPNGRLVFHSDCRDPRFAVTAMPRGAKQGDLKGLIESALETAAELVRAQQ
jgi:hypothetical protein